MSFSFQYILLKIQYNSAQIRYVKLYILILMLSSALKNINIVEPGAYFEASQP